MIKKLLLWFTVSLVITLLFLNQNVFASLKLNEIYPAPPSGEYEWIELYNDGDKTLDISNYQLLDLAGNKIRFPAKTVLPFSFIIATSSNILNNNGDTVFLKNNLGEIIEIATYSGTFNSSKTFAKCPDYNGNWFVLNLPTKNTTNEIACQSLTPTLTPTSIPSVIPTPTSILIPTLTLELLSSPTPSLISYNNIFISEAMVYPEPGQNEWVEFYNDNDFSVSLVNWYLDDIENGGSSPKVFSLIIPAKSYAVFDLSSSMFNNTGDSVRLLDFNKNLKDSFEYSSAKQNQSIGRTSFDSDDFCPQEPSKGTINNPCINSTPTPQPTPTKTPTITPTKIPSPTSLSFSSSSPPTKPVSINRLIDTKSINQITNVTSQQGEILGSSESLSERIKNKNQNKPLIQSLSFASFSYAVLVAISLILKLIN